MDKKSIRVTVYGAEYPLKVDNEEVTQHVAGKLNEMMHELHSQLPQQPPVTLAVLSALSVSENLYQAEKRNTEISSKVEEEVRSITRYFDDNVSL